jgi:23S rRNA (uracil1939-C5)-methyltransferase
MPRKKKKIRVLENIEVSDYAAEGRSLAKVDGKVIFIERTVPGDIVDVYLFKNKKDWAEGFPVKFHKYSDRRIEPFCAHFGDCGGCQWQMVSYEEQLRFKQQQVQDALQRIAKVQLPPIKPILGAAEDRYFRNKLEYTFGTRRYISEKQFQEEKARSASLPADEARALKDAGDGRVAGFHAKGLFDKVVDIHKCWLQPEPTNQVREAIRIYALNNSLSFYDVRHHTGFIRNVQLRICTTGEVMANLIVAENDGDKTLQMLDHLSREIPQVSTWVYTINQKKNDSLYDLEPVTFSGNGYVIEELSTGEETFRFKIGPKSFFQTNTKQAEQLYLVTKEFAELSGKETVYDLYCGTGSIGIFVSRHAGRIIGVELIAEAIHDARENAELNGLDDVEFFEGDVIDICNDEFFREHGKPDVIITDPPRAGMHEKLVKKILEMEAATVVYVSCNPATQARDLRLLDKKYRVTSVQPVDMFPHTHHIENVVQLKLK